MSFSREPDPLARIVVGALTVRGTRIQAGYKQDEKEEFVTFTRIKTLPLPLELSIYGDSQVQEVLLHKLSRIIAPRAQAELHGDTSMSKRIFYD